MMVVLTIPHIIGIENEKLLLTSPQQVPQSSNRARINVHTYLADNIHMQKY